MNLLISAAANALVAIHALFLFFVIGGVLLVFRWPRLWPYHLGCIAWGLYIEFTRVICPLTILEKWLRAQSGQAVYSTGFFERYVVSYLYPPGLPRPVQTSIVLVLLAFTAAGYLSLYRQGAIGFRGSEVRPPAGSA